MILIQCFVSQLLKFGPFYKSSSSDEASPLKKRKKNLKVANSAMFLRWGKLKGCL